jgi:hypothetical protein
MPTHQGSCHCGNLRFEIDSDVESAVRCNCSFCIRRSTTLHRVPPENFRVIQGEHGTPNGASKYGARDFSDHFFCPNCGIHCFSRISRDTGSTVNVNLGCFDPALSAHLIADEFDGANLL